MKRKFGSQSLKWQGGILEEDSDKPIQIKSTESHTPKTSQHSEAKKISGRCALRIEKKDVAEVQLLFFLNFPILKLRTPQALKNFVPILKQNSHVVAP